MNLQDQLASLFEAEIGISPNEVNDELRYGEVPEWDSGSHMIIVLALEERYDIEFDPDEIAELSSVAAIKAALRNKGING